MKTSSAVFLLAACLALTGCPDAEPTPDLPIGRGTSPPDGDPHHPSQWDGRFLPSTEDEAYVFATEESRRTGRITVVDTSALSFKSLPGTLPDAFAFARGASKHVLFTLALSRYGENSSNARLGGVARALDVDTGATLWREDRELDAATLRGIRPVTSGVLIPSGAQLELLDTTTGATRGVFASGDGPFDVDETKTAIVINDPSAVHFVSPTNLGKVCDVPVEPKEAVTVMPVPGLDAAALGRRPYHPFEVSDYAQVFDATDCGLTVTVPGTLVAAAGTVVVTQIDRLVPAPAIAPYPASINATDTRFHLLVHDFADGSTRTFPIHDEPPTLFFSPDAARAVLLTQSFAGTIDVSTGAITPLVLSDAFDLCSPDGYAQPLLFDSDGIHVDWGGFGGIGRLDATTGKIPFVSIPGVGCGTPMRIVGGSKVWVELEDHIELRDPASLALAAHVGP
ncbi:MAG: hypothetical protein U0414_42900 [Polyangiaceae bacterium]